MDNERAISTSATVPAYADFAALEAVQQRVLWLSTLMIHHANHVRPNPDGSKIGGHQASSASLVSVMTTLYLLILRSGDRVAVKPHASPVFHALQYLLGQLPQRYLTELRAFGGLQAYPSRTKDPDHVDFSTGSVGLGAVAPLFAGLAHQYAQHHFGRVTSDRFIALIGDAELDEGNIWEAALDHALDGLNNVLWIVDLNRQSLDRIVPGIRAHRLKAMFHELGWRVLEAKFGRKLQALFAQPGGDALRERIDAMSNEEYQALICLPGAHVRQQLAHGAGAAQIAALIASIPDPDLPVTLANLGGHDLETLFDVLSVASAPTDRPTVVLAYTIKGWGLPFAGHPLNHSMLLNEAQIDTLREQLGVAPDRLWDGFSADSPEGRLCAETVARLFPLSCSEPEVLAANAVPKTIDLGAHAVSSTQDAFGRFLARIADVPAVRERIVTTAPDVSFSTNLAGWINKTAVYSPVAQPAYEVTGGTMLKWRRDPRGQHIELGISEMNLFMLLGMFGLSAELCGQHLIPIGTVYDPFVCRGLDAFIYGLYSGAKFIVAGTPSGITLAPEGGAHQSTVTPSLGMELPNLDSYEPCYTHEVGFLMLEALRSCCDRTSGRSTYLRLSTRAIDQAPFTSALARIGEPAMRRQVIDGGYRLIEARDGADKNAPLVQLAVCGALVPEAVAAAAYLQREGVAANVLNLTSPRRLYETWRTQQQQLANTPVASKRALDWLILPHERRAPIITIHDAASHALAWLGSVYGAPVIALGVDSFGQSGQRDDLYRAHGIDSESIVAAAFAAIDEWYI